MPVGNPSRIAEQRQAHVEEGCVALVRTSRFDERIGSPRDSGRSQSGILY
jgi:hypothetical protein